LKKSQEPPSTYDIVAVCERDNATWCLLSTERALSSSTITKEEWIISDIVLSWMREDERSNALPPSIQQEFRNQTKALKEKIAALEEEVSGSKQLFDTYRERARVSLQKTANEQQEVEKLLAKAKDECKQQLKRADDAMKRVNQIETEYSLAIENLKAQLEGRDGDINRLKAEIAESKSQLDTLASSVHQAPAMDKSELIKIQDELQRARDEMKGYSRKILDLEDSIEVLKSREQKLIADQKKRSDAARELVETKDKEIARLEALVNDVRTPLAEHDPTTRPTLSDSIASASVVRNLQDRYRKFDYLALLAF